MERWRWMPRDLGKTYVMVNIPDYSLKIVRDGALYWNTKIVVGKPSQATPITSAEMKFITVNPTWNVPPSIIQNEYLPALQEDPTVLERMGLKIEQNVDGTVRIWQPPGDRNALGRIRFNFPNKFLVYQHDTPDKHLFAHDKRAYSHGCMRVNDPLMYGEKLLSIVLPQEGYTQDRLRKMFGGSEVNINFPVNIPVHLTYQSAFVDDAGKLVIREDIYGRDSRMIAALKGAERRVANIPMERPRPNFGAPVRVTPGTYGSAPGGPSFFDRLFGAPQMTPPPRPVRQRAAAQANNNGARSWR
jgi:murein L,D-transpeptidase YcbB/YkuD